MMNKILAAGTKALVCQKQVPWNIPIRMSSFLASDVFTDVKKHPKVRISRSPEEWRNVENLLPPNSVLKHNLKNEYPSTWQPVSVNIEKVSFTISRTKNNMIPVYLNTYHRGHRRITVVKHIEGNIWKLNAELKNIVEKSTTKIVATRVNEMNGQIFLKGDHVKIVHDLLQNKGF